MEKVISRELKCVTSVTPFEDNPTIGWVVFEEKTVVVKDCATTRTHVHINTRSCAWKVNIQQINNMVQGYLYGVMLDEDGLSKPSDNLNVNTEFNGIVIPTEAKMKKMVVKYLAGDVDIEEMNKLLDGPWNEEIPGKISPTDQQ